MAFPEPAEEIRAGLEGAIMLRAPGFLGGRMVDCSLSPFADDLFAKSILPEGTAQEMRGMVERNIRVIDGCLEPKGLKQNVAKLVVSPGLRSAAEGRAASRIESGYQVKAAHVLLGIEYPLSASFASEVARRLRAASRAWKELQGVWFRRAVGYRVKRNLFLGAVMGAALSGLTAVILSSGDLACDFLRLE